MIVRCKFEVQEVAKMNWFAVKKEGEPGIPAERVKLSAVYGTEEDPESISFSSATPTGTLEFNVTNPNVIGVFQPGQKVYLDLTII